MEIRLIPCECKGNCETLIPEFDSQGRKRRFVNGHQNRGKTPSDASRQKMSENHADVSGKKNPMFGKTHSSETKQKIKENQPDISGENHPNYGKIHSPESKQLMSENRTGKCCRENNPMFGKHHSPETKQLLSDVASGENHPNWQGGISKLPYCPIWTKWLKEEIKERDNFQCKNPNCNNVEDLCVHHIDYDKKNCSANNLITLCRSCNNKANFNREYWKNLYSNIIANFVLYREACPL